MDNNVLASLVLCKQKHLRRLNKRNSRRRALINIRHILLHATHTEVSSVSSNNLDMQDDNSLKTISCSSDSNFENSNHIHTYEVQNVHSFDNIFELSFNGPASDDMSEMSIDQQTSDEFNEYFNLSILFTQPNVSLHDSTNITKTEYCRDLLTLFRDATICKTHCDRFIRLICSGLPTLMKDLLNEMQGKIQKTKRILTFERSEPWIILLFIWKKRILAEYFFLIEI